jgi:hypothetical protein
MLKQVGEYTPRPDGALDEGGVAVVGFCLARARWSALNFDRLTRCYGKRQGRDCTVPASAACVHPGRPVIVAGQAKVELAFGARQSQEAGGNLRSPAHDLMALNRVLKPTGGM